MVDDRRGYSQQQDTEEDEEVEIEDVGDAQRESQYDAENASPVVSRSAHLYLL